MAIIDYRVYMILICLIVVSILLGSWLWEKKVVSVELRRYCKEKEDVVRAYARTDSARVLSICRELEKKYPDENFALCTAYLWQADVYKYWGVDSLFILYANKAMELARKNYFQREEALALLQLQESAQDSEKALIYLQQATILQKENSFNDPYFQYRLNYDYAYYYYSLSKIVLATNYFNKALTVCRINKLYFEEASCLNGMSAVLNDQKKYISALLKINRAILICLKYCPVECGDHYYQKGVTLSEIKKFDQAEIAVMKADSFYKKHPHPFNPGIVDVLLSVIYRNKKDIIKDRKYSLSFLEKSKFISTKMWAYNNLSEHYSSVKNYTEALALKDRLLQLKDSVYSDDILQMAADKRTQLELHQQTVEFDKNKTRYHSILIITCLLLIGATLLIVQIRRTNRLSDQLTVAEQQRLQQQVDFKERQLATSALHLSQHASTMNTIRHEIEKLSSNVPVDVKGQLRAILKSISNDASVEDDWSKFKLHFEGVSPQFFEKLRERAPNLTDLDLKQCAYLKMNMTPKQVAQLLAITPKGVTLSRVRIKKKLQLDEHMQLSAFLADI
ncbi:helix-turn-helix transcriptional regulator [Fibrella aquatica]|uniref:helix-turn-helix transcriptional regulator n=1 Tax=Fibrella aquatica TaxID=3242487 RepID=UPI003521EAAB